MAYPAVTPRVYAVDWSGDRQQAARKIWLAESSDRELVRLENGRSREDITAFFIEKAKHDPRFIVGFDFCFSFPLWFCRKLGAESAAGVWRQVTLEGEQWIMDCRSPFWGRRGKACPAEGQRFRTTERDIALCFTGTRPKSIFQIGGAGAIGTGSLRGMPVLAALREAGFSIWPFDPSDWPRIVEIYPRALTGPVNKSSLEKRRQYLRARLPHLSERRCAAASSCEDAFDAAVSVLVMQKHIDGLARLGQATDHCELLEGRIWYPELSPHTSPA